jgi:polar amino acid transport system substrate-binding protein
MVAAEKSGELPEFRVGIDSEYEPFSYVDENGNYAGLDVELAREAASRMGREAVFVPIKWDKKNDYLADGSINCVWSCFSMNGRESDYDWVGPYMHSRQVVAVRQSSDIMTLSDLAGKRVAVISSTKPESLLLEGGDGIPDVAAVYCLDSMDLVFAALEEDYVDAVAGHETAVSQYMDDPDEYRVLDDELLSADVGVAFGVGLNPDIQAELTEALDEMRADGTMEAILSSYGVSMIGGDGQ